MSNASALSAQRVIGNAQYSNYYASMQLAVSDGQNVSDEAGYVADNKLPEWIREQSKGIRNIRMMASTGLAALSVLSVGIDENDQGMKVLRDVVAGAMMASAVYSALRGIYLARTTIETAIATAEAGAAALAQNWIGLAAAGTAMAATYAAFSITSNQNVISVADVSTPQGRREAQAVLGGVMNG